MAGHRIIALFAAPILLIWATVVIVEGSEISYTKVESLSHGLDSIVQELHDKYGHKSKYDLWDLHYAGDNDERREVIRVERVEIINMEGHFIQWKHIQVGLYSLMIGLMDYEIRVFDHNLDFIGSHEISYKAEKMTAYAKYDEEDGQMYVVIIVASNKLKLHLYEADLKTIRPIGEFGMHYRVKEILYCNVGRHSKIFLVPAETTHHLDVYNIDVYGRTGHIWFFQRLPEMGHLEVALWNHEVEYDTSIAIANGKYVSVYEYEFSRESGLFVKSKTLKLEEECHQLVGFSIAYRNYMACPTKGNQGIVIDLTMEGFGSVADLAIKEVGIIKPVVISEYLNENLLISYDGSHNLNVIEYVNEMGYTKAFSCSAYEGCPESVNLGLADAVPYYKGNSTLFLLPSKEGSPTAAGLRIYTVQQDYMSPMYLKFKNVLNRFEDLSKRFESWHYVVAGMAEKLERAISSDRPNIITGSWAINQLDGYSLSLEKTHHNQENKKPWNQLYFLDVQWNHNDFNTTIDDLNQQYGRLESFDQRVSQLFDYAVLKDTKRLQVVDAPQTVYANMDTDTMSVKNINVQKIGDKAPDEFFENFALLSDKISLNEDLNIQGSLSVDNLFTMRINDVDTDELAVLSKQNVFNGPIAFNDVVAVQKEVKAPLLNGINLPKAIMTIDDVYGVEFKDPIRVTGNSQIEARKHEKVIDFDSVFLSNEKQNISSTIVFEQVFTDSTTVIDKLNKSDFIQLFSNVITTDYSRPIVGETYVDGVVETQLSLHLIEWNDKILNEDFVRINKPHLILKGENYFRKLQCQQAEVDEEVNGKNTDDLVSLHDPASLRSRWTFNAPVTTNYNFNVLGLVNEHDIEDIKHKPVIDKAKEIYYLDYDVKFKDKIIVNYLGVNSTVNNATYEQLFAPLISFLETEEEYCFIPGTTTVEDSIVAHSLDVESGKVNDIDVLNTFLTGSSDQHIEGAYYFMKNTTFYSIHALDKFDTVPVRTMFSGVLRSKEDSTVYTSMNFTDLSCESDAVVSGGINDFKELGKEVVLSKGRDYQVIYRNLKFSKLEVDLLEVDKETTLSSRRTIGGIDILSWYAQRFKLSSSETIHHPLHVNGTVVTKRDILANTMNGVVLHNIANSVLRSDKPDQIFKNSFFCNGRLNVEEGTVKFEKDVSEFVLDEVKEYALNILDEDLGRVPARWRFHNMVISGSLHVDGNSCGANISMINTDAVRKDEDGAEISGPIFFDYGVKIKNNIFLSEINGENIFEKLFLLHSEQEVQGRPTFHNTANFNMGFEILGSVNDYSVDTLEKMYAFEDGTHKLYGDLVLNKSLVCDDLNVEGTIQGERLSTLLPKAVNSDNPNEALQGKKVFETEVIIEDDIFVDIYNHIDLAHLSTKLVLLSDDLNITLPAYINQVIADQVVLNGGNLTTASFKKSANLDNIIQHALRKTDSRKKIVSKKNLVFDRLIVDTDISGVETMNGVLYSSLIPIVSDQYVGSIKVKRLILDYVNLFVHGRISGMNITHKYLGMMKNSLKLKMPGHQLVSGPKVFKNVVTVLGDLKCLSTELRRKLVFLDRDQVITSRVHFEKPLVVTGNLNKMSEKDDEIDSLLSKSLMKDFFRDDAEVIDGNWDFAGGITVKEYVDGHLKVDDYVLSNIVKDKQLELKAAEEAIRPLTDQLNDRCNQITPLLGKAHFPNERFQFFELHQMIGLDDKIYDLDVFSESDETTLITSRKCGLSISQTSRPSDKFTREQKIEDVNNYRINIIKSVQWDSSVIILFQSIKDEECPHSTQGFYYKVLHNSANISSSYLIDDVDRVQSFEVVTEPTTRKLLLMTLHSRDRSSILKIMSWDSQKHKFNLLNEDVLHAQAKCIASAPYFDQQIAIAMQFEHTMRYFVYSVTKSTLILLKELQIVSNPSLCSKLLLADNALYSIIFRGDNIDTPIKPYDSIQVFKIAGSQVTPFQTIQTHEIKAAAAVFRFNKFSYLSIATSSGIHVYKHMGLSGFQLFSKRPLRISNGVMLRPFFRTSYGTRVPYLAVLSPNTLFLLRSNLHTTLTSSTCDRIRKLVR